MDNRLEALQGRLGHRFDEPRLLQRALTHRSFGADHNERLEFLGDAVLNLAVFQQLNWLNLSRTPITSRALAIVDELPNLRTLSLDGTNIGWLARRRVERLLRKRAVV